MDCRNGAIRRFNLLPYLKHYFGWGKARSPRADNGLRQKAGQLLTQIQISRMQSVLQNMSDRERESIGLDRRDIRAQSEFLVTSKSINT